MRAVRLRAFRAWASPWATRGSSTRSASSRAPAASSGAGGAGGAGGAAAESADGAEGLRQVRRRFKQRQPIYESGGSDGRQVDVGLLKSVLGV